MGTKRSPLIAAAPLAATFVHQVEDRGVGLRVALIDVHLCQQRGPMRRYQGASLISPRSTRPAIGARTPNA